MDVLNLGIFELKNKLHKMDITARDIAVAALERIEKTKELNSFICVLENQALAAADAVDEKIKRGAPVGRLAGVPVSIKDNMQLAGSQNTCASNFLRGYECRSNSAVAANLIKDDAVIIGKVNMDEFAMGVANNHSAYGPALNPLNKEYVPGGSSGGSAASVAAGHCYASLGSDTGGSIRQPAGYCGIVGLKPTYGSVSSEGVIPMAPSLDQVGPLAKNTEDCALVYSVISGKPEAERAANEIYEIKQKEDLGKLGQFVKGKKIAVAEEFSLSDLAPELRHFLEEAKYMYQSLGAEFINVGFPAYPKSLAVYNVISYMEASACLGMLDGIKYGRPAKISGEEIDVWSRTAGFGSEVKKRIMMGTFFGQNPEYWKRAQFARKMIRAQVSDIFKCADFIFCPSAVNPSFKAGHELDSKKDIANSDMYTVIANLTGIPAISVPCGIAQNGLPYGLQLMSAAGNESGLFYMAACCELAKLYQPANK